LLTAVLACQAAAAVGVRTCWPWEYCCYVAVCSAAQSASAPTGGGEGRGHTVAAARLQLVKQALNDITSSKLLGLHIDSLRPWISHIDAVIKKVSGRLYFIKQPKRAGVQVPV